MHWSSTMAPLQRHSVMTSVPVCVKAPLSLIAHSKMMHPCMWCAFHSPAQPQWVSYPPPYIAHPTVFPVFPDPHLRGPFAFSWHALCAPFLHWRTQHDGHTPKLHVCGLNAYDMIEDEDDDDIMYDRRIESDQPNMHSLFVPNFYFRPTPQTLRSPSQCLRPPRN